MNRLITTLDPDLTIRPPTWDDVTAAADLFNAYFQDSIGVSLYVPERLGHVWERPGFSLANDARVVETRAGRLVGYLGLWNITPPYTKNTMAFRIHPDFKGRGIGTTLTHWAEDRAHDLLTKAPFGTSVRIETGIHHDDSASKAFLEGLGYRVSHHYWRMVLELSAPPVVEPLPSGFRIITHAQHPDQWAVYVAEEEAWGHIPTQHGFQEWLTRETTDEFYDPSLWFLVMAGDEIAALALTQAGLPENLRVGYVRSVGVRPAWRRRGLGLGLLQHAFAELFARNKRLLVLDVNAATQQGATRLYEKAGMQVLRQIDTYSKVLGMGLGD